MKAPARIISWAFLAVLLAFIAIKLGLAFFPHVVIWDEAVYMGMGKYIFSFWGAGLWEIFRPLVLPLMIGAIWKIFPSGVFFILSEMLLIGFAAGYAYVSYGLGKELFGVRVGAVTAIIILLTPIFFLNSGLILSDIPSAFFILVAMLLALRKRYFAAGLFASLAFLTRFPHGIGLFAIALVLLVPFNRASVKNTLRYCIGAIVPIVPFFVFNYFMYKNETSNFAVAVLRPIILGMPHQSNPFVGSGSTWFYFIEIFRDNPVMIFALLGIFAFVFGRMYKDRRNIVVFVPFMFYLLYFSSVANKQLRFGIAFLFGAAMLAALGIEWVLKAFRSKRLRAAVVIVLVALLTFNFYNEWVYTGWRHHTEPAIVGEFYRLNGIDVGDGGILTADPVPAAYTDKLFVPYYFSSSEGLVIVNETLAWGKASAAIYKQSSFPCADKDEWCVTVRKELVDIVQSNTLIFNKSYYGEEYLVYSLK